MWMPLAVLAVLSLVGGFFDLPHFLEPVLGSSHAEHEAWLEIVGSAAGLIGIAIAYFMYVLSPGTPEAITSQLGRVYSLVYDKYRVDELYDTVIVAPLVSGSRSILWKGLDAGFVDGLVNGTGSLARMVGGVARWIQTGNMRSYGAWVVLGSVVAIAVLGFMNGGAR